MYSKKYMQLINIYCFNTKTLQTRHEYKMIFITNNLNSLENYIFEECKKLTKENKKYNLKYIYDLDDSYFRDLNSLKLEDLKDFNFYTYDYLINTLSFTNQTNWSYLINDQRLKDLLQKDLTLKN